MPAGPGGMILLIAGMRSFGCAGGSEGGKVLSFSCAGVVCLCCCCRCRRGCRFLACSGKPDECGLGGVAVTGEGVRQDRA